MKFKIIFLLLISLSNEAIAQEDYIGVEINPFTIYTLTKSNKDLSFGINYFKSSDIEIAIPVIYKYFDGSGGSGYDDDIFKVINLDLILRIIPNDKAINFPDWFYLYGGGFIRYTYLYGATHATSELKNPDFLSINKIGIGLNIGFKMFFGSKNNFFWGMSVSGGKYITGNNNSIDVVNSWFSLDYDKKNILDYELAKIGYIFK